MSLGLCLENFITQSSSIKWFLKISIDMVIMEDQHDLIVLLILKIKSVSYSSQGSHTGLLDFCIWLADDSTSG